MRALELVEKLKACQRELKEIAELRKDNPKSRTYLMRYNQLKDKTEVLTRRLKAYGTKGELYIVSWTQENKTCYVMYNDLASESEATALFKIKMPHITEFTVRALQPGKIYNYSSTGK